MPSVSLRRGVARVMGSRLLRPAFDLIMKGQVVIFMMHRFETPETLGMGDDPEWLRQVLRSLRESGTQLLRLEDAIGRIYSGRPARGVVFTVDDGYFDFAEVGHAVFREFDCPVTVFLTTGFIDGAFWFWWDRLEFAIDHTEARRLTMPDCMGGGTLGIQGADEKRAALKEIIRAVKGLEEPARLDALSEVSEALRVPVPDSAPAAYRPMEWSEVRRLRSMGVRFAPHTVTHPSLGTLPGPRVREEVRASWNRLIAEGVGDTPVFCYPYGLETDVTSATAEAVEAEGLHAAVTACPGYASAEAHPFLIPRFSLPRNMTDVRQIVVGAERFKMLVRRHVR